MALTFHGSKSLVLVDAVVLKEELVLKELGLKPAGVNEGSDVFE